MAWLYRFGRVRFCHAHRPPRSPKASCSTLCSALVPTNGRRYEARGNQYPAACPSLRLSDAP